MTTTTLPVAAADQLAAHRRATTDAFLRGLCAAVIAAFLAVGAYAVLAASGHAPAAPWSPIGIQQQQHKRDEAPAPSFIPPPVPAQPDTGAGGGTAV